MAVTVYALAVYRGAREIGGKIEGSEFARVGLGYPILYECSARGCKTAKWERRARLFPGNAYVAHDVELRYECADCVANNPAAADQFSTVKEANEYHFRYMPEDPDQETVLQDIQRDVAHLLQTRLSSPMKPPSKLVVYADTNQPTLRATWDPDTDDPDSGPHRLDLERIVDCCNASLYEIDEASRLLRLTYFW